MDEIVIVGASLAGVRAAEALRRGGHTGGITLVGREEHFPPYDRPPLSKEILSGEWATDRGRLRVDEHLDATLRLGTEATGLALAERSLLLSDGDAVAFDGVVIATGATPRTLRGIDSSLAGIFVLRTLEEAIALRTALDERPRVAVIGAGFIGAEVAAVCRGRGLAVTVFEPLAYPMERALGAEIGGWAAQLHRAQGVDLRLGTGVSGVIGTDRVEGVVTADGTEVPADVVVVAVGVAPEVGWLEGSGLAIENGVVCDSRCRALGANGVAVEGVVAAGDVARWWNPTFGQQMRVEHWANAVEQGEAAAATLLGGDEAEEFTSIPYFWSIQYSQKIQFVGIGGEFSGVVEGGIDEERFVATYELEGRLVGALCVNAPARLARYRKLIAERTGIDEVLSAG
jgi:NADPH-dependent 2,4-dienoyl-CoA reductase/sulfur reductase-like enzyme